MLLQYGIAYEKTVNGLEKQIMRYPQFFATKAIERKIDNDIKKGIIWHTQGSGKTALALYNVQYLTDYFRRKNIIPKFYFIVDRIDLLNQAKYEHDTKFARLHKRILERGNISKRESEICDNLTGIKKQVDEIVLINEQLLNNEPYFYGVVIKEVIKSFEKASVKLETESAKYINGCLVKEYVNEYKGIVEW